MKIVWFVSSLEQKGGGERFVLEAVSAINKLDYKAIIVCDRLNSQASFDGAYSLESVITMQKLKYLGTNYYLKLLYKANGLFSLYWFLKKTAPDLVICQSEFDTIKLWLLSKLLKFKYRTFVFGQMFQFRTDITKYSLTFRRFLKTIVDSRPGYLETVSIPPPKFPLGIKIANEIISVMKKRALQSADRIYVLSNQVKWEVSLLYDRDAKLLRAAFKEEFIDDNAICFPKEIGKPVTFLSVSRLVEKKRIDLIIKAFSKVLFPAQLIIVGSGPDMYRLKTLVHDLNFLNKVIFLGSITDSELSGIMKQSDCFVSMDIGDYDISVVEAMGKGKRIIVSKDFDLNSFGEEFRGVHAVNPEIDSLSFAMNSFFDMSPPSKVNLPILYTLTWENLASQCVLD